MNTKNDVLKKINNDEIIYVIKEFAQKNKAYDVYLVGGVLRDFFLGKDNFDKDIVVKGAKDFSKGLSDYLNGKYIELDKVNNIYRIVLFKDDVIHFIDVAELVGENIADDLKRRDLALNSICFNLLSNEIIDFQNGIQDLKNGVIRANSEENFLDDNLRLLRVFRFEAILGYKID